MSITVDLLYKILVLRTKKDETRTLYVASDGIEEALKLAIEYCDEMSKVNDRYLVVEIKNAVNGIVIIEGKK